MAKRKRIATDEELFLLRREGVSYRDIANYFGISVDSVRGRVSRFRKSNKPTYPPIPERIQRAARPTPSISDIQSIIEDDEVAQHIGIDDNWINDHIHIDSPPPIEDIHYISVGFATFAGVEKRVIGSGIEDYMHIWYDHRTGLWYYGVECISPPCD